MPPVRIITPSKYRSPEKNRGGGKANNTDYSHTAGLGHNAGQDGVALRSVAPA